MGAARSRLVEKLPWFAGAALCLAADLWTKHLVFYPHALRLRNPDGFVVHRLFDGWQIILAYNQGVTFGLASGASVWLLALGTSAVIALLGAMLWQTPARDRVRCLALSMIIGGAVGNLYDRTLRPRLEPDTRPGVRDFLDWYVPEHWDLARWLRSHDYPTHWYTSNVADVLIVAGVILLTWRILREPEEARTPAEGGAAA